MGRLGRESNSSDGDSIDGASLMRSNANLLQSMKANTLSTYIIQIQISALSAHLRFLRRITYSSVDGALLVGAA